MGCCRAKSGLPGWRRQAWAKMGRGGTLEAIPTSTASRRSHLHRLSLQRPLLGAGRYAWRPGVGPDGGGHGERLSIAAALIKYMRAVRWVHGAGMHGAALTAPPSQPPPAAAGAFLGLGVARGGERTTGSITRQPPPPPLCRHCLFAAAASAALGCSPTALAPPSRRQDVREKAAAALVETLVANQAEFEAESGAEGSDEEEANGAVGGGGKAREVARALRSCSPLMIYAFKRLCRGLGSSRQGARQGFSLAIASLLGAVQCIGPAEAVTAIEGVLEPVGKVRAEGSCSAMALLLVS